MNIFESFFNSIADSFGYEHAAQETVKLTEHIVLFILVVAAQYILIRLTNYGYRRLKEVSACLKTKYLKPIDFNKVEFLSIDREEQIIFFLMNILRYVVIIIQLLISIPIIFSIFPETENLATQIISYITLPLKKIGKDIILYIPNVFIIAIFYLIIKYLIKGLEYIALEIERGKLKINGFYSDWAKPTFAIIRFLLYAFMVALIYPYLPNSGSGVFQGISIFVGVIATFASSSAIGNLIAGIVITYMRPFQIGDRIKINDVVGNVLEKTPVVTRLLTLKNEIVTIPNSTIMNSQTTNLSESARTNGLIVHFAVAVGYDQPWRTIHQLLIDSAVATPDVMTDPHPFVHEHTFEDFYVSYEINAYINDAQKLTSVTSSLREMIQDKFKEAGISILSPHFYQVKNSA